MSSLSPPFSETSAFQSPGDVGSTGTASFQSPATGVPHAHLRSCKSCRSRKIKCDRQRPCGNCARASNECVYPSGPGRAPKKPRRVLDACLLDRLSRLDALMKRLDNETEKGRGPITTTPPETVSSADPSSEDKSSQAEQQFGRLVIDDTRSCYVSNILWASLGDEVEELRDLLHEPASDADDWDEDFDTPTEASFGDSVSSLGSNAAIMGFQALAGSLRPYHPPLSQSVALLEIFKQRVAPLVHIFHMPTMIRSYWDAIGSPELLNLPTEALLFAIYYSSIISMEPHQCEQLTGVSRTTALKHYQFAVQQAMARADLLNTQSIVLLQAVVLFLSALRNEDASRTVWSLTALIFHVAQAMGLHRDGASFGLRPLETELRRRLWWHICLLDIRSSEYHGCEPIVHESSFDTHTPLNINDNDITAEMTTAPAERDGPTEMTFCLIRCEVMRVVWKTGYIQPSKKPLGQPPRGYSFQDRTALAKGLQDCLQERYLKHCNSASPFLLICKTVAQLIIARTWLVVYYPLLHKDSGIALPSTTRDQLFTTSIKVLELSNTLLTSPDLAQWQWHSKTHIQWHAAAFVLSEICSRPPSAECDHAWEYVQTVYNRWKVKENKGNLWRPIKRLMAKAQYVREIQRANRTGPKTHWRVAGMPSSGNMPSTLEPSSVSSFITYPPVTPGVLGEPTPNSHDHNDAIGAEPLDPLFFDMLPKEDMFGPTPALTEPGGIDFSMADWVVNSLHEK